MSPQHTAHTYADTDLMIKSIDIGQDYCGMKKTSQIETTE